MTEKTKRLVVSFIGNADIEYIYPKNNDTSPILRLLMYLTEIRPFVPLNETALMLFDDDAEDKNLRTVFCQRLHQVLPQLGLDELKVERCKISLPEGPTDMNALYENVWRYIPTSGVQRETEVIFHLSSGTPVMKFTLMLAAHCLPLKNIRMYETSNQKGVMQINPPYVLAAREIRDYGNINSLPKLSEKARSLLLTNTVITDRYVQASYAKLYKAAVKSKMPSRVVIKGPVGSGKWHACKQFSKWRNEGIIEWRSWKDRPAIHVEDKGTLLIWCLNHWPEEALKELVSISANYPNLAIAATFRTDRPAIASRRALAHDGLRFATHVDLPSLGARSDVVELGESLVRQLGLPDGKLKKRLQYDLLSDLYPRNLHDLGRLLATASALSSGAHVDHKAFEQTKQLEAADEVLARSWEILVGLKFGKGRPSLENVLDTIRSSVVRRARFEGRSQQAVGELLGISQQRVSEILNKEPVTFASEIRIESTDEKT